MSPPEDPREENNIGKLSVLLVQPYHPQFEIDYYFPDHRKPFILETDASAFAVGGVLKQVVDSKECPVLFFSHTLSKAERNYSTYERELLALVKSVGFFPFTSSIIPLSGVPITPPLKIFLSPILN